MHLLKITAALATTFFFATNAAAYDWTADRAKGYGKVYTDLKNKQVSPNTFSGISEAKKDLKACELIGGTPPNKKSICDNICKHLEGTITQYNQLFKGSLAPWDTDQSIVGNLKAAKASCGMDILIPGTRGNDPSLYN